MTCSTKWYRRHLSSTSILKTKSQKTLFFLHIRFHGFFSILIKYLGQISIAKKTYTSFCSPFNSASNHIWDVAKQRSAFEMSILIFCLVSRNQMSYRIHIGFIFEFFFLKFFHYSNWIIYQSVELELLYKMVYMTFSINPSIEVEKSKYCIFWRNINFFPSILMKYLYQKMNAKRETASSYSPFNSALNNVFHIVLRYSTTESLRLKH